MEHSQSKRFTLSNLHCHFCGKSHKEVKKLIAGPAVYICNECVVLCADVIAEQDDPEPKEQPTVNALDAMSVLNFHKQHASDTSLDSLAVPQLIERYSMARKTARETDRRAVDITDAKWAAERFAGPGKLLTRYIDPRDLCIPRDVLQKISRDACAHYGIIPIGRTEEGERLEVAIPPDLISPTPTTCFEPVIRALGEAISAAGGTMHVAQYAVAPAFAIREAIAAQYTDEVEAEREKMAAAHAQKPDDSHRPETESPRAPRRASRFPRRAGKRLMGIEETNLTKFLAKQYGVPAVNLEEYDIPDDVLRLIPHAFCLQHQCIPVHRTGATLIVAVSDPSNIFLIDDLKFLTGYTIEVVTASDPQIGAAIVKYYANNPERCSASLPYEEVMTEFDEGDSEVEPTPIGAPQPPPVTRAGLTEFMEDIEKLRVEEPELFVNEEQGDIDVHAIGERMLARRREQRGPIAERASMWAISRSEFEALLRAFRPVMDEELALVGRLRTLDRHVNEIEAHEQRRFEHLRRFLDLLHALMKGDEPPDPKSERWRRH